MKLSEVVWLGKAEAAKLLGCSTRSLITLRQGTNGSEWQEGIHFMMNPASRRYEYNQQLLLAWKNRGIAPHQYTNTLQSFLQAVQAKSA